MKEEGPRRDGWIVRRCRGVVGSALVRRVSEGRAPLVRVRRASEGKAPLARECRASGGKAPLVRECRASEGRAPLGRGVTVREGEEGSLMGRGSGDEGRLRGEGRRRGVAAMGEGMRRGDGGPLGSLRSVGWSWELGGEGWVATPLGSSMLVIGRSVSTEAAPLLYNIPTGLTRNS